MNIVKSKINIGLKKPVGFLHITDTHILNEDNLAREKYLEEFVEYADKNNLTIIHTGDFVTFFEDESLDIVKKCFGEREYIFSIGNHDYCRVGEAGMDVGNVARNGAELAKNFKSDLEFSTKIINGELNVVTLNNAFFRIESHLLDRLKAEVKKGLPIILCMHVPFFAPDYAEKRFAVDGCAHLLCPPDEYVEKYPKHCKFEKADKETDEAAEYIKNEPMIKVILAGHTHMNYENSFESGAIQLSTAAGYDGFAREIIIE